MAIRPLFQGSGVKSPAVKLSADLVAFSGRIGHDFNRPELLLRAITHSSLSSANRPSNERLEFLGDRVLALSMAEALFQGDTDAAEGQLAPRFNALVRQETCADVARDIALGDVLKLGRSEMMSGGRRKEALLGDALEAVIAAVYLDAGFETARAMVLRLWGRRIADAAGQGRDPKSALQEWAQARGLPPPSYTETDRSGPDHQPIFTVEARLQTGEAELGQASGKRQAEQAAARALLARMEATS
jgi:ribonuclease-3